jgi:hypothetical protein
MAKLPKLPRAEHPLPQMTSTELAKYITDLRAAQELNLSDEDHTFVLERLGKAYAELNTRSEESKSATDAATDIPRIG